MKDRWSLCSARDYEALRDRLPQELFHRCFRAAFQAPPRPPHIFLGTTYFHSPWPELDPELYVDGAYWAQLRLGAEDRDVSARAFYDEWARLLLLPREAALAEGVLQALRSKAEKAR